MGTSEKIDTANADKSRYDLATRKADYPDWEFEKPLRTYLLCSHTRCGSTLLGEAMYFAGGMGCPIEYFHRGFQPALLDLWNTPDQDSYVKAVYRHRTDPGGSLGVKLFWMDVIELCLKRFPEEAEAINTELEDQPEIAKHVYDLVRQTFAELFPNPHFIFLTRQDRLRHALSSLISGQVRIWRNISGVEEREPVGSPVYDYERILNKIRHYTYCESRWSEFFQHFGVNPYRITYEDMVLDYHTAIKSLLIAHGKWSESVTIRTPRLKRQANHISEQFALRFLKEHASK